MGRPAGPCPDGLGADCVEQCLRPCPATGIVAVGGLPAAGVARSGPVRVADGTRGGVGCSGFAVLPLQGIPQSVCPGGFVPEHGLPRRRESCRAPAGVFHAGVLDRGVQPAGVFGTQLLRVAAGMDVSLLVLAGSCLVLWRDGAVHDAFPRDGAVRSFFPRSGGWAMGDVGLSGVRAAACGS